MADIIGVTIPVLREDHLDYRTTGNDFPSYVSKVKILPSDESADGEQSAEVIHKLEGECLVHELVRDGRAQFGCELIFKGTFLRRTELIDSQASVAECIQTLRWQSDEAGRNIFFRPVVVATTDIIDFVIRKQHNVSDLWMGEKISIPKYSLLADGGVHTRTVRLQSIISILYDRTFEPFEMEVSRAGTTGSTHFIVRVGKSLLKLIGSSLIENRELRKAVLINALTGAFAALRRDYLANRQDERSEIENCEVLQALRLTLIERGGVSWDNDEVDFCPVKSATLYETYLWSMALGEEIDNEQ